MSRKFGQKTEYTSMPSCSRARPLDSVRVRSPSNDMNTHGCVSCSPAPQQRDRLRAAPHVKRSWIWVPLVMASALEGCSGSAGLPEVALPPSDPTELFFAPDLEVDLSDFESTSSGLYVQDVSIGDGPVACFYLDLYFFLVISAYIMSKYFLL